MHWLLLSLFALDCVFLLALTEWLPALSALLPPFAWLAGHVILVLLGAFQLRNMTRPGLLTYLNWLILLSFIPGIGFLMGWLFLQKDKLYRAPKVPETTDEHALHYFDIDMDGQTAYSIGKANQRVNALTDNDYLDLLTASQQLEGKQSVTLLKEAFNSQTESARLLAHALYAKKEKQLTIQLAELLDKVKKGHGRSPQLQLAFAQLYWHWAELGMLDEKARAETLEKIRLHASLALKIDPDLAQADWLIAQTWLEEGNYPLAEKSFQLAMDKGLQPERITPHLQEIRFRQSRPVNNTPLLEDI